MSQQKLEVTLETWNMGIFTHIAFFIRNTETNTFYDYDTMDGDHGPSSSSYTFELQANIEAIDNWWAYERPHHDIFSSNCGDITQAFLEKFAEVPAPSALAPPFTVNHLGLGLCLPSFLPVGITLPGRIFDHAKFHLELRRHPEIWQQLNPKILKLLIGVSITMVLASVLGIAAAATFLSATLMTASIVASVALGSAASIGLFKCINRLDMISKGKEQLAHIPRP